jgi:hypothetical protein
MMSLGVHLRIIGRPGRIGYLERFRPDGNPDPNALGPVAIEVSLTGGRRLAITVAHMYEVRPGAADPAAVRRELEALLRAKLGVEVGVALASPGETAALTQIEARQKPVRLVTSRAGRPRP